MNEPRNAMLVTACLALAYDARMYNLVLRYGDHHFGDRAELHVWWSARDHRNAALMILLAYILLGHGDWARAELRIFAAYPDSEVRHRHGELRELITTGRIPISGKNIQIIPTSPDVDFERLVEAKSREADLVVLGFGAERLRHQGTAVFRAHRGLHEVLWVSARERIDMD